MNKSEKHDSIRQESAVGVTFLLIATFLYLNPEYLGSEIFSLIVIVLSFVIGVSTLGIALNKISDTKNKLGFDDLGIGLGLGIIWAVIYYYFPIFWVNILTLVILFFGIYGVASGILGIIYNLLFQTSNKKKLFVKIPIVIVQFTAFIAAVFTILNILEFI